MLETASNLVRVQRKADGTPDLVASRPTDSTEQEDPTNSNADPAQFKKFTGGANSAADDPVVLSYGQERLWMIQRLFPGDATYNLSGAIELRGERDWIVVVTLHHIVSDGWSMNVLARELLAAYEAVRRGGPGLPPLSIQYADYAQWQREWLRGEVLEKQLSYWRSRLQGAAPQLELPTDRSRPPAQSYRGENVRVVPMSVMRKKIAAHMVLSLKPFGCLPSTQSDAVQSAGKGRTLSLATDAGWYWAFKNVGARVLSYQVDSLTRNNNYVDAEIAIRESYASGRSTVNGFPVINHGVGGLRRIISEVQVPLQTRHSTRDPRLLAEISYAGGVTAFEGGSICYTIPYYKNYPPDQSIAAWQYVDYLTGLYFKRFGIVLDREFFGTLTATLIPPCLAIATGIIEAILAIQQGVKCVSLGYAEQGDRVQDIAGIRVIGEMAEKFIRNLGYKDVQINTVFHQYMAAFLMLQGLIVGVFTALDVPDRAGPAWSRRSGEKGGS